MFPYRLQLGYLKIIVFFRLDFCIVWLQWGEGGGQPKPLQIKDLLVMIDVLTIKVLLE